MSPKPEASCICRQCGKEFTIESHRLAYGEGKYCSRKCGWAAQYIPLHERFWSKVQKTDQCWLWTGAKTNGGYGKIRINGTNRPAPRVAWEFENGSLPIGYEICHHCDNPSCVRPDHLFAGTRKDNVQDMIQKGRRSSSAHGSGERHGMAKLTNDQVVEIRQRKANGESAKELSEKFSINRSTVHDIVTGKSWKHILEP